MKLTARSALLIAVLYPFIAVLAGLLARILFGGDSAEGDLNISTLIDTGPIRATPRTSPPSSGWDWP